MKKGFTMIELVFVIVILGILASIAVPKMVATRDDATAAKAVSEMKDSITQLAAYYTINGSFQDRNGQPGYQGMDITTKTGETNKAEVNKYSPTIAEVLNRANDKWTDCFNITLVEGGTINIKNNKTHANEALCRTLKNVPAVQTWAGGTVSGGVTTYDDKGGNTKVGGSGIYSTPTTAAATASTKS